MARPNKEVEALLQEYADLVSITGTDAYRARAYEKAARAIGGCPTDVSRLDAKHLREIPNVGKSIAGKVEESLRTGHMAAVGDGVAALEQATGCEQCTYAGPLRGMDDGITTWPLRRLRQFLDKARLREGRTSRPAGGKE